jgi:ribosomal protein L37E
MGAGRPGQVTQVSGVYPGYPQLATPCRSEKPLGFTVSSRSDMNTDDEDEALKHFFWQAYPNIARPHECMPSHEWIRDHLPNELREEYWAYVMECDTIRKSVAEWERARHEETGELWDVQPSFPELPLELIELVLALIKSFETEKVKQLMAAHGVQVHIPRCRRCNRILRTTKSQQCFQCGYDWHDERKPNNEQPQGPATPGQLC